MGQRDNCFVSDSSTHCQVDLLQQRTVGHYREDPFVLHAQTAGEIDFDEVRTSASDRDERLIREFKAMQSQRLKTLAVAKLREGGVRDLRRFNVHVTQLFAIETLDHVR